MSTTTASAASVEYVKDDSSSASCDDLVTPMPPSSGSSLSSSSSSSSSSFVDESSLIGSENYGKNEDSIDNDVAAVAVATTTTSSSKGIATSRSLFVVVVVVVLEIGLVTVFLPFSFVVMFQSYYENHLLPLFQVTDFLRDNRNVRSSSEVTYYHRNCESVIDDMTATSSRELIIDPNLSSTRAAATQIAHHGVGIFPNVVSRETAEAVRNYVLEEEETSNKNKQSWFVLEQENRYTWGLDVTMDPSIQNIIQEIASHELLLPTIEHLVGTKDPAIIEFSIIGSKYGAKHQNYHPDVYSESSGTKYIRTFTTPHSLFIPLQDTTHKMGATQICPGSHLCTSSKATKEYCEQYGFPISTSENRTIADDNDDDYGIWNQGYAAVYNQQMFHRGAAHIDPNGPDRVILVMTFVSRPTTIGDKRQISLGGTYSLPWYLWGTTFSDYYNAAQQQAHDKNRRNEPPPQQLQLRTVLRSLGLIQGKGWNLIDTISSRLPNEDYGYVLLLSSFVVSFS